MRRYIISITLIISANLCFAQSWIETALKEVEQNNPNIKSGLLWKDAKQAESKMDITPENPFVSAGWFPAEDKGAGTKKTWGVSQTFNFPTVYFQKVKRGNTTRAIAETEFRMLRQEVLLDAKVTMLEFIYEKRLNEKLKDRVLQTEQLVLWFKKRLETGDASALDYNNTQARLLEINDRLLNSNATIEGLITKLHTLNGGNSVAIKDSIDAIPTLPYGDSIIADIKSNDPRFLLLALNTQQSMQNLSLAKHQRLPNFEIGYESEQTKVETFRGVKVGLSIPLWGNAGQVKTAKANKLATEAEVKTVESQLNEEIEQLHIATQNSLKRSQNLKDYIKVDNSYSLLKKSLEMGNISVINFFNEVEYLFELNEKLIEAEKDFAVGVAKLERYKL